MHWPRILAKLTFFNDEITIDKMFETVVVAYNTDDNIGECIFSKQRLTNICYMSFYADCVWVFLSDLDFLCINIRQIDTDVN